MTTSGTKPCGFLGKTAGALALACGLLFLPALLNADEIITAEPGFFTSLGLGAGLYSLADAQSDAAPMPFTIGIESRFGGRIDDHFSVFLLAHFNVTDFRAAADFSEWIFEEQAPADNIRFLLIPFIPLAVLFDSQLFVGPGVAYRFSPAPPSVYVEGGLGYSGIQSISERAFIMGAGLFAGAGVEITPRLGCGLRVIWSPSFLHSGWTPSDENYFSIMAFLYLL
jgi:hypothetical protein